MSNTTPGLLQRSDAEVRDAVFIVNYKGSTGTGFLTLDRQHILTAHHVVVGIKSEQQKVEVQNTRIKEPQICVVQRFWVDWDIALLRLEKPIEDLEVQPFYLSQQKPVAGNDFSTYGFPFNYDDSNWFYGKIGNEEKDKKYTINFRITYSYENTLEGLSGGPIFDVSNTSLVIGIICEQEINYQIGKMVPTIGIYKDILDAIPINDQYLVLIRTYSQTANDCICAASSLFDEHKTSVPKQFKAALELLETAQEQLRLLFNLLTKSSPIDHTIPIERSFIILKINIVNQQINNHLVPTLSKNRLGDFSRVMREIEEINKLIPPSTNPQ